MPDHLVDLFAQALNSQVTGAKPLQVQSLIRMSSSTLRHWPKMGAAPQKCQIGRVTAAFLRRL
ncbi:MULTISPECIES: hypothetical protein [unclassified Novosphingobium]|uniref:hypothetical protein n=1 Tax=unclassified Novosphingobium TaxID=2644732 RepID=UPI0025FC847C|nr:MULTISPECIES: hypothetical protein [unclassified Novosphingobium]MDR6708674.1 hypothetical protein [Novosphingobium sp. 1748]